jgi:hypothetical protein
MRVKLKTQSAGPNGSFAPGIHDLPDVFARQLVDGGYAEALEDEAVPPEPPPAIETAAIQPAETAVIPKAKHRAPAPDKTPARRK